MGLIDQVKERVDLKGFIEGDKGCSAKKEGAAFRINPCPLCHHKDCFTIYPEKQSFHCFSCEKGGTVIDYIMCRHNITDPLEAARLIADKAGIDASGGRGTKPSKQKEKKDPQKPVKKRLSTEKAAELRRFAVDFYHGELLNNGPALDYQMRQRRHSTEALVSFSVGYASDKSLIKHLADSGSGFQVEDLEEIGLVRKRGKGYSAVIPKGSYIYPHISNGRVLYVTIKTPKDVSDFQVKKACADAGWLCFNQDVLNSDRPVLIVEGENDLLTVVDLAKHPHTIAVIGNFNTTNICEYLKAHAKGRKFFLCFDRDDAGKKYVVRYAAAIMDGGGEAYVVRVPEPHNDIDEFLRDQEDPESAFKNLMSYAEKVELGGADDLYVFKSFTVLGELEDGSIVFQARDINKIHTVNIKDLTLQKLIQIGGDEVRWRVVRKVDDVLDGKIHLYDLQKYLILQGRRSQLGPLKWLGQGINLLDDGRLLIVDGSEAHLWDDVSLAPYVQAVIEKKVIERRSYDRWINFPSIRDHVLAMNHDAARKTVTELRDIVDQWGFEGKYDVDLVTGFILSQIVQAIWAWRPHLWITGPQGSGKTILLDLFKEIGGDLARNFEGSSTSEAGFRQGVKNDFILATIDEFERSNSRESIIAYLRTAGRGGQIVKGTPGQEAMEYRLRHMVVVASIETGLVRAAEKTRFILTELKKDPSRNPQMPRVREMDDLRRRVFAVAVWASLKCKKLISEMDRIKGYDPRLVEAYCVPLSMMSVFEDDPLDALLTHTNVVLADRMETDEDSMTEDEDRLLDDVLSSTIRVSVEGDDDKSVYTERSIHWLLNSPSLLHHEDAAACGVWSIKDGSVFFATDLIKRKLLRDTLWKDLNITGILRRLEGAEWHRVKRGGKFFKGIRYESSDLVVQQEQKEMF